MADRCLQNKSCLVLDESVLTLLRTTGDGFVNKINLILPTAHFKPTVVDFDGIERGYDNRHRVLVPEDWTAVERTWVTLIERQLSSLCVASDHHDRFERARENHETRRNIVIGVSDTASGWTDARSYVAINRAFLADQSLSVAGITAVGWLVAHELAHDRASDGTHVHGVEFYERFHRIVRHGLPEFVASSFRHLKSVFPPESARKSLGRVYGTDMKRLVASVASFRKFADDLEALLLEPEPVHSEADPA